MNGTPQETHLGLIKMTKNIYLTFNQAPKYFNIKPYEIENVTRAAEQRGYNARIISPNDMYDVADEDLPFAAIAMQGGVTETHLRFLRDLELRGVKTVNPVFSTRIADDKMLSYIELKNANFPIPKTIDLNVHADINNNVNKISTKLKFPCVIKIPNSGLGFGIHRVMNANELYDLLGLLALCTLRRYDNHIAANLLAQEYVKDSEGRAIRVVVVDNKCIGALYKTNSSGWKTNSSNLGRKTEPYHIDSVLEKLSLDICKHLNLNFAGIDFHTTPDGYLIGEINSSPILEHFESMYPNIKVSELLLDFLIKQ